VKSITCHEAEFQSAVASTSMITIQGLANVAGHENTSAETASGKNAEETGARLVPISTDSLPTTPPMVGTLRHQGELSRTNKDMDLVITRVLTPRTLPVAGELILQIALQIQGCAAVMSSAPALARPCGRTRGKAAQTRNI
jgi:hypothetical protein